MYSNVFYFYIFFFLSPRKYMYILYMQVLSESHSTLKSRCICATQLCYACVKISNLSILFYSAFLLNFSIEHEKYWRPFCARPHFVCSLSVSFAVCLMFCVAYPLFTQLVFLFGTCHTYWLYLHIFYNSLILLNKSPIRVSAPKALFIQVVWF